MPEKIFSYLKLHHIDIVMAVVIAILGLITVFVIKNIVNRAINKHSQDKTAKLFLANLFHIFLLIIILIMVLNKLGVPTTSLIAVLGASSLAIALALKDSLSNVASGIMLIFCQPFKIGDSIETSNITGSVVKISLYNTTLKMANNDLVFVPNSKIFNDKIIKHSNKQVK